MKTEDYPLPEESAEFWDCVYTQCESDAIDMIYDRVDDYLLAGRFETCDRLLRLAELTRLSPGMLLSLLTVTSAAKDRLPARQQVVDFTRGLLGVSAPEAMKGLE